MFGIGGVGGKGIIPAYAGNTVPEIVTKWPAWDHPRVCGEHSILKAAANASTGSSPRMRGTPQQFQHGVRGRGIIPAYAGNTGCPSARPCARWDHPRVCGEHFGFWLMVLSVPGSSPRMRGTHYASETTIPTHGIIPAYAGNTETWDYAPPSPRDHPRVCGEHTRRPYPSTGLAGSSPRMRGTLASVFC